MTAPRWLIGAALALAAFFLTASAGADAPDDGLSADPVLRIETGEHTAAIHRIATDSANRFAVTASDDKTARVWSLPDGKLLKILRAPLGLGNAGRLFAVAMSPDGAMVAVGGWTGQAGSRDIYLFDRATGALKKRLPGLPNSVANLAWSPDGKYLAACLGHPNGVRIFDAGQDFRLMPRDANYGGDSYDAGFDGTGRLVTASFDHTVRLYAAGHYDSPIASFSAPGLNPYSAAFSPDGQRVAVGFFGSSRVSVLSGSGLTRLFEPNTSDIPDNDDNSLGAVGWSSDGRFLFAGGEWQPNGRIAIRRWSDGGKGAFVDLPAADDTIMQIIPMRDGRMLFAALSGFGLIGPDGAVTRLGANGALDLRPLSDGTPRLHISADGMIVKVDPVLSTHSYRFAPARRQLYVDPAPDNSLLDPVRDAPGVSVQGWQNTPTPSVNGAPLKLDDFEYAESLAIVTGTRRFVLGTNFWLRLFDQDAHELWRQPAPDDAWHVNVTGDGRLVVAAYGDGTIRWHRVADGREVLALFIDPDGARWVAWTPEGYYDASIGGDGLIGWHVNHGFDQAPDFYPVSQFRDRFYRPDVIQRILKTPTLTTDEALRDADQAAGRATPKAAPVSSLLTPVIEIDDPKDPAAEDRTDIELGYSVRMPFPDDTLRVEAQVDGALVASATDKRLVDTGSARAGILHLHIPGRDSLVSLIAYNNNGASEPAKVHVHWTLPGATAKLNLYVLAIGISDYKDPHLQLHFAAKDANDFVALARRQEGGLYEKVITHPPKGALTNADANKNAVLDELDWIMHQVTNTNDVAMVFISGHGVMTPDQHYRFLPYNYDPDHVERTTISDLELQDYLTKIGGKKIFFFDTCYSGNILGGKGTGSQPNVDKFANELRDAKNGIVVFASSTGDQLSQEKPEWGNGAFTKAVVEGMHGAAAQPSQNVIMISDLDGYVSRRVKELTNGVQRPGLAMPKTVEDYPIAVSVQ